MKLYECTRNLSLKYFYISGRIITGKLANIINRVDLDKLKLKGHGGDFELSKNSTS